ncbi:hypothetical protein [Cryobacterium sp. Y11]|uniref:hypothetical protein n=1 Tax=Cryobacterium sp. Y11 TaxID=2045016 RepID=UPI000CE33D29|nr:hypothetical protein [Cryobacterium sp. Y11]
MDTTLAPDLTLTEQIENAGLRYAYARAFRITVPDAPADVDPSLLLLLRERGLTEADALRVLAADQAMAPLPKDDTRAWTATDYNIPTRQAIVQEFSANSGKRVTWPPRHNKFSQQWSESMTSAGLPFRIPSAILPSKAEAIAQLWKFLNAPEGSRSTGDYVVWRRNRQQDDTVKTPPSLEDFNRVFGSWGQALDAAGMPAPVTSTSAQQAEDAVAKLAADLERHQADAEKLRKQLGASGGATPDVLAHHTELAYLVALETHALESSRVNEYLLKEREKTAKTLKRWAIAGGAALAIVPPLIEFLLAKYL